MKNKVKNNLEYKDGVLHLDGCNLVEIAGEYKTPLYVYSANRLIENYRQYEDAFSSMNHIICYAIKANYSSSIIKLLSSMGAGADVVSGGELYMALRAGIKPEKIVFSGVGKTCEEIRQAINTDICFINIESEQEFKVVREVAAREDRTANVSFRINPDIDSKSHPKIATGLKESKFGMPVKKAVELYKQASKIAHLNVRGMHLHIGSQITDTEPFRLAAESAVNFVTELEKAGIKLEYIDIGGGLGIDYGNIKVPSPYDIADAVREFFVGRSETLIIEPGRSLVGNAGYLLTRINYIKERENKKFVVVDAGFNDLIRPAMYGAYHKIIPVKDSGVKMVADVVGPVCETSDCLAVNREVSGVRTGNVLAVCDSGAYGFSMSSNYNSRLRPPEVLIDETGPRLIRRRENFEDLIATEQ